MIDWKKLKNMKPATTLYLYRCNVCGREDWYGPMGRPLPDHLLQCYPQYGRCRGRLELIKTKEEEV